jgi:hypothetical protein
MNKLLLAATLLTALSTPALAAYSKAQSELNPRGHVVSESPAIGRPGCSHIG